VDLDVIHVYVHGMHLVMLSQVLDRLVCLTEDVVEIVCKFKLSASRVVTREFLFDMVDEIPRARAEGY